MNVPPVLMVALAGMLSAAALTQEARLMGTARGQYDNDGQSVSISGNRAIVSGDGDAYIFVRNGTSWTLESTLVSGEGTYGAFGLSVAIDGDLAVVGAFLNEAAYVFVRNGSNWTREAKLTASDGAAGNSFGAVVAMSGSTVVVGAPDSGNQRGAAYVFVRSGTSWSQQAKLVGSDATAGDLLTSPVGLAVDGNTVAAGSTVKSCLYVFVRNGTSWTQQAKLEPAAAVADFAWSLDVNGDRLAVNTGEVYERSNGFWTARPAFSTPKSSVAISGSRIVAGDRFVNGTGAAFVYKLQGGSWVEESVLTASDRAYLDIFGDAVDIDGDYAVVGAPGEQTGGVAYTFGLPATLTPAQGPLRFVAVTPCRVADTRNGEGKTGSFGPPSFGGGQTRDIPIPLSTCGIPASARAYSLNVTVVPQGPLSYLTIWPAGFAQPLVSTLNSFEGRIVANMAIVPAGSNGAISVFVTNPADVILDINGYFAP